MLDLKVDASYKSWQANLQTLGFKRGQLDVVTPIQQEVSTQVEKIHDAKFIKAQIAFNKWKIKLKKILSDPLAKKKRRGRRNANRKYPHMISKKLRDSIQVDLYKTMEKGVWSYTVVLDSDTLQTDLTNSATRSTRTVAWKDWFDNTMNEGHSSKIVGAKVLMDKLFSKGYV